MVDYHIKFLIVKRTERLSADDLMKSLKIILAGYGPLIVAQILFQKKIQEFCRK